MDVGGLCYIYSNSTRGCTGSSEAIAELNGTSCSIMALFHWQSPDFSTIGHNERTETNAVNVTVCGPHRQAGQELAWITADKSGLLKFQNIGGDSANCTIGKEFTVGTSCSALSDSSMKSATETPTSASSTKITGASTVGSSSMKPTSPKPVSMDC
ncbi:hypothetical protein N7513_003721 [Penicillium frequentans]|nr:hypothetical protein N7513_003721 [Penicillium glabrum]